MKLSLHLTTFFINLIFFSFLTCVTSVEAAIISATATVCVGKCPQQDLCWPAEGSHLVTQKPYESFSHSKYDAIDIGTPTGTNLYSPATGNITYYNNVQPYSGYGCVAVIDWNSYKILLAHMTAASCLGKTGQTSKISRGDFVGRANSTGYSTGPHLHLEIVGGGGSLANSLIIKFFNKGQPISNGSYVTGNCR